MAETAIEVQSLSPSIRRQAHFPVAPALLFLVCLIVLGFTRAHYMGDTNVYTQAILRHENGAADSDYRSITGNPFWDFGHILWRPLAWLCFRLTRPLTQFIADHNPTAEVVFSLLGISLVAGLLGLFFFYRLTRKVTGNEWAAVCATVGLLSADAFLNYFHSGNAYVTALACLIAGMYVLWAHEPKGNSYAQSLMAAVLLAMAVFFWLPYVFVLPAAIAGPLFLYGTGKRQQRLAIQTILACAVIGVGVYSAAARFVGIHDLADLKDWALASGHGRIQPVGFRAVARLAIGLPRSFIDMGRDGMWLKRYLVHDPYAPVTMGTLFRLGWWKFLVFYVPVIICCLELPRTRTGRNLLWLLAAATLPVFIFAIFIFEAGASDRYLPLYPFAFLAFGYVLGAKETSRASKSVLLVLILVMIAVNVNATRRATVEKQKDEAMSRIRGLLPQLGPNSLVLAVNEQDSLAEFRLNFPLDPINLSGTLRTYDVLEINTERLATWRRDLAKRVLARWDKGGTIWIPVRFLSPQPQPDWNWVEGDDPRVKWSDLPAFFAKLHRGPAVAGQDGFEKLDDDPNNREILQEVVQQRRDAEHSMSSVQDDSSGRNVMSHPHISPRRSHHQWVLSIFASDLWPFVSCHESNVGVY